MNDSETAVMFSKCEGKKSFHPKCWQISVNIFKIKDSQSEI